MDLITGLDTSNVGTVSCKVSKYHTKMGALLLLSTSIRPLPCIFFFGIHELQAADGKAASHNAPIFQSRKTSNRRQGNMVTVSKQQGHEHFGTMQRGKKGGYARQPFFLASFKTRLQRDDARARLR